MTKETTDQPHLDPERVTPLGMLRFAIEYYAMGVIAKPELSDEFGYVTTAPHPITFALGRSIELGLKAFLLEKEMSPKDIKDKLGHNLKICLEEAEARSLADHVSLDDTDRSVLSVLHELYASKELEYIVKGSKIYPQYEPLQSFAQKLLLGTAKAIPKGKGLLWTKAGLVLQPSDNLEDLKS